MSDIRVESSDVVAKPTRQTTVCVPKGTSLYDLFNALRTAEGSGYLLTEGVTLKFQQFGVSYG